MINNKIIFLLILLTSTTQAKPSEISLFKTAINKIKKIFTASSTKLIDKKSISNPQDLRIYTYTNKEVGPKSKTLLTKDKFFEMTIGNNDQTADSYRIAREEWRHAKDFILGSAYKKFQLLNSNITTTKPVKTLNKQQEGKLSNNLKAIRDGRYPVQKQSNKTNNTTISTPNESDWANLDINGVETPLPSSKQFIINKTKGLDENWYDDLSNAFNRMKIKHTSETLVKKLQPYWEQELSKLASEEFLAVTDISHGDNKSDAIKIAAENLASQVQKELETIMLNKAKEDVFFMPDFKNKTSQYTTMSLKSALKLCNTTKESDNWVNIPRSPAKQKIVLNNDHSTVKKNSLQKHPQKQTNSTLDSLSDWENIDDDAPKTTRQFSQARVQKRKEINFNVPEQLKILLRNNKAPCTNPVNKTWQSNLTAKKAIKA